MQGELRGDITRDTYSPQKQFLRVLMQQGRVQIDADFNEQVSILLHYLQTLATDLIGPYGVPAAAPGFEIGIDLNGTNLRDLTISKGRYYLEGLLCENDTNTSFEKQPYFSQTPEYDYPDFPFLVYLDVWERHVDHTQDGDSGASIREVALGGPDTATRSKVIWQVRHTPRILSESDTDLRRVLDPNAQIGEDEPDEGELFALINQAAERLKTDPDMLKRLLGRADEQGPTLKARAAKNSTTAPHDPCTVAPDSRYRGAENQLYRVEVHTGGDEPTFKWSRENSAVVFPIASALGQVVTLEHLGYDSRFSLREGDWVEVIDDAYIYRNEPKPLLQVKKIDLITLQVTLSAPPDGTTGRDRKLHPALRRWDHKASNPSLGGSAIAADGALPIQFTEAGDDRWQTLENGVQVQFQPGTYRPGDYWLVPARTATGNVEWPQEQMPGAKPTPQALPPHGVKHYYAPLALIAEDDQGKIQAVDCRYLFAPLPPAAPAAPPEA
ncbi:DUF6519 domain-containing protein [Pseudanabaena sp. FACHB-2040]|uniref:DUF6519 domain-containing protein n=1 Tax=Pseudanabaena sp. FACHB-2040 TaxID=2692859 RepID=UPI0016898D81|nr:DUF6519 domain-containing protein [Pseudanabaena sp. FACHB-2040]MBD2261436.1 hypothetical protein [Pseudanabaena sp. FACHB-2040]